MTSVFDETAGGGPEAGEGRLSTPLNCKMMDARADFVCSEPAEVSDTMALRGGSFGPAGGCGAPGLAAGTAAAAAAPLIGLPFAPIQKNFSMVFCVPNNRANSPHFRVAEVRTSNSGSSSSLRKVAIKSSCCRGGGERDEGEAEEGAAVAVDEAAAIVLHSSMNLSASM